MNKARLLKLAKHLETGKLGHKKFDFSTINEGKPDRRGCGTAGCAMGELPIVFPRQWKFSHKDVEARDGATILSGATMEFFGIGGDAEDHLFYPDQQDVEEFGGVELGNNATRKQVASNIRAFIKKAEAKE